MKRAKCSKNLLDREKHQGYNKKSPWPEEPLIARDLKQGDCNHAGNYRKQEICYLEDAFKLLNHAQIFNFGTIKMLRWNEHVRCH